MAKMKGTFCEEQLVPKQDFDSQSFRWKKSGKVWILTGCAVGKWQPRKHWKHCRTVQGRKKCSQQVGKCSAGTRAYVILRPAKGRCSIGTTRITKG